MNVAVWGFRQKGSKVRSRIVLVHRGQLDVLFCDRTRTTELESKIDRLFLKEKCLFLKEKCSYLKEKC